MMRSAAKKRLFWQVKAASPKTGEVFIYGDIVSDKWYDTDVTAKSFQEDLEALGDVDTLNIYINSYGGSVFQAQAIYSILKRHAARVNVYIDGIAASAASLVAVAGDTVYMPKNAMMMVHWPWSFAVGNAKELRREADALDKIGESMVAAYLAKTGDALTGETLAELLDAETWMTAEEAVGYGLADELVEAKNIAASVGPEWAETYLSRYRNIPEPLKNALKNPQNASENAQAGMVPADVSRETAPEDTPWEAPDLEDFTDKSWDELTDDERRQIAGHYAWAEEMPPETFGSLKLPHHLASDGKVVWRGVTAAAARLDQASIPEADKDKVRSHLASHYHQFGRKAPWEEDDSAHDEGGDLQKDALRTRILTYHQSVKALLELDLQGV